MAVSLARPIPSNDIFLCIGADSDCIEKFFASDTEAKDERSKTTNQESRQND